MSEKHKILIIEDSVAWCESYRRWMGEELYEIKLAFNITEAMEILQIYQPDVILLDLGLPQISDGMGLLEKIVAMAMDSKIIVVTSYQEHQYALEAQRKGAYSYFSKGENIEDELPNLIKQAIKMLQLELENKELRLRLQKKYSYDNIIAVSRQMQEILDLIDKIKLSSEPVLIYGESGVGKEIIAQHIYSQNEEYKYNFVPINCAALPAQLLESELFGYEKGAFTGATKRTRGKIELANLGTLFLDEIGDMPAELQSKFLRVLESKKFFRLGGQEEVEVDFRFIAATNKNLAEMVADKRFREDLYYRLNVIPIHIPPLRERPDDIPALINFYMDRFCRENNLTQPEISDRTIAFLSHLRWEGNVRELVNAIKRLVIMNPQKIDIENLPPDIIENSNNFLDKALSNELTLEDVCRVYAKMVLELKKGNKKEACKHLDINYRTLINRLK